MTGTTDAPSFHFEVMPHPENAKCVGQYVSTRYLLCHALNNKLCTSCLQPTQVITYKCSLGQSCLQSTTFIDYSHTCLDEFVFYSWFSYQHERFGQLQLGVGLVWRFLVRHWRCTALLSRSDQQTSATQNNCSAPVQILVGICIHWCKQLAWCLHLFGQRCKLEFVCSLRLCKCSLHTCACSVAFLTLEQCWSNEGDSELWASKDAWTRLHEHQKITSK